ncbi:MAG: DNA methyltransferase [Oligoflexia bacterium]|nr:DNA methyltransferase [Oligoflexia bacterium]
MRQTKQFLTIKEASAWAKQFLKRNISESNISYLIQYGKIKKYSKSHALCVSADDLKEYYQSQHFWKEDSWKKKLGADLNWSLSFDHLREKDTTKHVHRIHPYKGKFIPQLVEYFIDSKTDSFKKEVYFKQGDILLDPFSGSGTTLVQALEMGLHSIGIDASQFNCLIGESKLLDYDFPSLKAEIKRVKQALLNYESDNSLSVFENNLALILSEFNNTYFPSPDFKYQLERKKINEAKYAMEKEKEFLDIYNKLVRKYKIQLEASNHKSFLDKWYIPSIRKEMDFIFKEIQKIKDKNNKKILSVILSRTVRSCRATTHYDLATLKQPQVTSYYCWKHKKICKPLFSIKSWFNRYSKDTVNRIEAFTKLKTKAFYVVIPSDSRTVDIFREIKKNNKAFYKELKKKKIKGIFSSPPYVGQIDYHEQHAYAYDLLGLKRKDNLEIGPLYKGQGATARESYVKGISDVLKNSKRFVSKDFHVFLVANDKHNLYPSIAERAGMKIVNQFKRPVLNRTERDKNPYSEFIFHLQDK